MDKRLGRLARGVAFSFRLYPRGFRQEFEHEMRSVYCLAAQEARRNGVSTSLGFYICELGGVLVGVISEYRKLAFDGGSRQMRALSENDRITQNEQGSLPGDSRSWAAMLAGSAIYVIWGLEAICLEIAFASNEPWYTACIWVSQLLAWLVFLLPPIVVGYGWTRNFPRWTYPYIGAGLVYAAAMDGIPSPEFPISSGVYSPWGWRAWIPLFLALTIALLVTRSLHPFTRFFSNAWQDWTLLSYAMFGWAPLLILAGFDEVSPELTLIFIPIVVIVMAATATLYLASPSISQRGWILFAGAFFSLAIMLVVTEIYWNGIQAVFDDPRITLIMVVFLGVMFTPGLIGVFRYFQQRGAPRPA